MYTRTGHDGEGTATTLDFGVSGKLWNGVLVMYDRATDSLWTQLDGRAFQGPLEGQRLEHFPSTFTTWGEWRRAHPDTLVLEKLEEDERTQQSSHYADYFANPDDVFFPELGEGLAGVPPKLTIFGVFDGDAAVAVSADMLSEWRVVETELGGQPMLFLAGDTPGDVAAFAGQFALEPIPGVSVMDRVFDRESGVERAAAELAPLRVDRAFWYAWIRAHPGSEMVTPEG